MRRLLVLAFAALALAVAQAGAFLVHVKWHDGVVYAIEMAALPVPDASGMYRFHLRERGCDIVVHASNVWIEQKTSRKEKPAKK